MTTTYSYLTVPPITASTNLGPLTTSTAFPANCLNNFYDLKTDALGITASYPTQGCALSTCCPSNNFYTTGWGWLSSYYSPAVCPQQYKSCAPPAARLTTVPGETIIFCCPNNYDCPNTEANGIYYYACGSPMTSPIPLTVLEGVFDQISVSTRLFSPNPVNVTSYVLAYPIQIRFQRSELITSGSEVYIGGYTASTTLTSAASTSNTATATTSSSSGSSAGPNSPESGTPQSSGGLSTGAKAGIGVGAALGVLLIIGLSIWLFIARRKQKKLEAQVAQPSITTSPPGYGNFTEVKDNGQFAQSHLPYVAPSAELEARTFDTQQIRRSELP